MYKKVKAKAGTFRKEDAESCFFIHAEGIRDRSMTKSIVLRRSGDLNTNKAFSADWLFTGLAFAPRTSQSVQLSTARSPQSRKMWPEWEYMCSIDVCAGRSDR
jgi:hypothetical protein